MQTTLDILVIQKNAKINKLNPLRHKENNKCVPNTTICFLINNPE
jgi:hypothetical protein